MANVNVDIDLEDIDEDDIILHCAKIMRKINIHTMIEGPRKKYLIQSMNELKSSLKITNRTGLIKTLNDEMKMEHIESVFTKYSLTDLQRLLP